MLHGIRAGFWSITSEKDPRWNAEGEEEYLSVMCMPDSAKNHLENCKKLYGDPPSDLEYSCFKYD